MNLLYVISFLFFLINDFILYLIFNISIFQLVCNNLIIINNININNINIIFYLDLDIICIIYYNHALDILFSNIYVLNLNCNLNNLNYFNNLICYFNSYCYSNALDFIPTQSKIYLFENEPILSFYQLYNKTNNNYICYSYYELFPKEIIPFFIKEQCFCMEDFVINSNEISNLPIVFHLTKTPQYFFFILTYIIFIK